MKKGFTFIEIIIVVALTAVLAIIVVVLIRPGEQLERMSVAKRGANVSSIDTAIQRYIIDKRGDLPPGVDGRLRMLGTAEEGCAFPCARERAGGFTKGELGDYVGSDFNQGDHNNTFYDTNNSALTISGGSEGNFESRIFDTEEVVAWSSLTWQPLGPYGKNLPTDSMQENAYESGNVNMQGNVLLFHFDEGVGTESFSDKSSTGASGTCGSSCPGTGVEGVVGAAASFDGLATAVVVANRPELNTTSQVTLMSWVKWSVNPASAGQWTSIINKGVDGQYRLQHNSSNTAFEMAVRTSSGARWAHSTTVPQAGEWYHVVGTYDGSEVNIYVNGELEGTASHSGAINTTEGNLFIGARSSNDRHFNGTLDEVAVWNKALSEQEIVNIYKRGALQANFQVRSCGSSNCVGVDFVGPEGVGSYYNEAGEFTNQLPQRQLQGISDNRYFQYRVLLKSKNSSYTPFIRAVSLEEEFFGEVNETVGECLNLVPVLVPDYINEIPYDPDIGSPSKTHYAIYQTGEGRVIVVPCFSSSY